MPRSLRLAASLALVPVAVARADVCAGGRFLVRTGDLVTGVAAVAGTRAVVIGPSEASIEGLCKPAHVRLTGTLRHTHVAVTWPACARLKGRVGARRVLAVATTGAVTGKEDDDRIAFDCARSGSDSPN